MITPTQFNTGANLISEELAKLSQKMESIRDIQSFKRVQIPQVEYEALLQNYQQLLNTQLDRESGRQSQHLAVQALRDIQQDTAQKLKKLQSEHGKLRDEVLQIAWKKFGKQFESVEEALRLFKLVDCQDMGMQTVVCRLDEENLRLKSELEALKEQQTQYISSPSQPQDENVEKIAHELGSVKQSS